VEIPSPETRRFQIIAFNLYQISSKDFDFDGASIFSSPFHSFFPFVWTSSIYIRPRMAGRKIKDSGLCEALTYLFDDCPLISQFSLSFCFLPFPLFIFLFLLRFPLARFARLAKLHSERPSCVKSEVDQVWMRRADVSAIWKLHLYVYIYVSGSVPMLLWKADSAFRNRKCQSYSLLIFIHTTSTKIFDILQEKCI